MTMEELREAQKISRDIIKLLDEKDKAEAAGDLAEVERLYHDMRICNYKLRTIKAAIDRIPDLRIRTAAICRYLFDMSWKEVAQHLGPEETPDGIGAALERHIRKCGGMYDE